MAIDTTLPQNYRVTGTRVANQTLLNDCRLVINAAFLQEIKDSNPDLWHAMHRLRQICESDDSQIRVIRELVQQLDDLRDRWAMQFALEESYGYIQVSVRPAYPGSMETNQQWQSNQAETALHQHCSLYLMLRDLAEQAEELQYRGVTAIQLQQLIRQTWSFNAAIIEHEAREQELIEFALDAHK